MRHLVPSGGWRSSHHLQSRQMRRGIGPPMRFPFDHFMEVHKMVNLLIRLPLAALEVASNEWVVRYKRTPTNAMPPRLRTTRALGLSTKSQSCNLFHRRVGSRGAPTSRLSALSL